MSKRMLTLSGLILLAVMSLSSLAQAQDKPIQLSLLAPIQLVDEGSAITGLRLSLIYGKNTSVTGLDWGLINHTTSGMSSGIQWGLVGLNEGDFKGWQGNFVNITAGSVEGLQWGFFNQANYVNGVQIGFVNSTNTMKGLQIGLLNFIKKGGQFPVFPIVNWSM